MEAEVHEEFYQERNRLFTNFSHELYSVDLNHGSIGGIRKTNGFGG